MRSGAEMAARGEAAKTAGLNFSLELVGVKYRYQSTILSVWDGRAGLVTGATVLTGVSVLSSGLQPEPQS